MDRLRLAASLALLSLVCGCRRSPANSRLADVIRPERIASSEILMTATLGRNARVGTTVEITLRNVGQRTLAFDTGISDRPMADFAFSLELPDHQWLQIACQLCMPGVSFNPAPYTVRLRPSELLRFSLPLSTLVAENPHTGDAIDIHTRHGRLLVELQVPTPPNAQKNWPGYVNASVLLP